ncbi:uncharacterized protein LOC108678483 [Hyalella azteca]|uniref:Uncharacterized protein LOC108678483 n=1 Tax=Hyalella azteca TaxID=294128 RepID=A0A8B7P8X3_HYAAZ|nr:uncharacterized protein LOC108678483 [Hyalella azteca]
MATGNGRLLLLVLLAFVAALHQHSAGAMRPQPLVRRWPHQAGGLQLQPRKDEGRSVRYKVDRRRPEKYFAGPLNSRHARAPRPQASSYRPFSRFMNSVSAPIMRAAGGMNYPSEPRTFRNFMGRFRQLIVNPINRYSNFNL